MAELRLRLVTDQGVLLIYDAGKPDPTGPSASGSKTPNRPALRDEAASTGPAMLAWWADYADRRLYVYGRVLTDPVDAGHALQALSRDLGVDATAVAMRDGLLLRLLGEASLQREDATPWHPAGEQVVAWIVAGAQSDGVTVAGPPFPPNAPIDGCDPDIVAFSSSARLGQPSLGWNTKGSLALASAATGCSGGSCNPEQCDDGNICTQDYCDPDCGYIPLSGYYCEVGDSDGNPCTKLLCTEGECLFTIMDGGRCEADGNDCTRGVCEGEICIDGIFDYPDGTPCTDDGYPCTDDECFRGSCSHPPKDCDDNNLCTEDMCNDSGECVHTEITCDDGADCTDDSCCSDEECCDSRGNCVGEGDCLNEDNCPSGLHCNPDANDCVDTCESADECNDGDPCTIDLCYDEDPKDDFPYKRCHISPKSCDDGNPCTIDRCNGDSGNCENIDPLAALDPEDLCDTYGCIFEMYNLPQTIPVNNDDDDGDGIADYAANGFVAGDDELYEMVLTTSGCLPASGGTTQTTCPGHNGEDHWHAVAVPQSLQFFLTPQREFLVWPNIAEWPPPETFYVDARQASSLCPEAWELLLYYNEPPGYCCRWRSETVRAFAVTSLKWEKADPTNLDLDNCPNNGGKRIFPGKIDPNDTNAALRRKVNLVATIQPPIADVDVYFKVWDVDDPFDQLNAGMPDVNLIDADFAGPDNRGTEAYALPWTASAQTVIVSDEQGTRAEARVTFEVSVQPGNNYRAGASVLNDAINQADQTTADEQSVKSPSPGDAQGYAVPLVWSKMLTVWRKLHVETDSMVRPTFAQNTFTMPWNEPRQGPAPTQVVFDVNDPPVGGGQTADQQFTQGYVELQTENGTTIVTARIVDYESNEGPFVYDDAVTINIPDCGNNQSGLACLGGVTTGTAILSDDDLSVEATFTAGIWGCDDLYADPTGFALSTPDLSWLALRYHPAYIDPVHETGVSGVGGVTTFLRNQDFGVLASYGKALWDQVLTVRNLPVSTADFWTVMLVSGWQAEERDDADPNAEAESEGSTLGINTHANGSTTANPNLGATYTGICAVFKAVAQPGAGESDQGTDAERSTIAHEIGHTFGLAHSDVGPDDPPEGLMDPVGDGRLLPFVAEDLKKLREYVRP